MVNEENKYLRTRIFIAFILYLIPLVAQAVIIYFEANESIKTLGIVNLIFIMSTDLVILSLREQTIEIQGNESRAFFIYEPIFQAMVALLVRAILCFVPQYWLITYSVIFFSIQLICAFDLSQTILIKLSSIRDE